MKSQEDKQQYIHCSYDVLLQRRKSRFGGGNNFFVYEKLVFIPFG